MVYCLWFIVASIVCERSVFGPWFVMQYYASFQVWQSSWVGKIELGCFTLIVMDCVPWR